MSNNFTQSMWNALRVKSRNEKKVASRLINEGFEVYCPEYLSIRRWSDRRKKVSLPLFNGYVFVKESIQLKDKLYFIPGIVNFVYYNGETAKIRSEEIDRIKRFTGELSALADKNVVLNYGDEVNIVYGNFEGQKAKIDGKSNDLLVLTIEGMGIHVQVKLPDSYLEKA